MKLLLGPPELQTEFNFMIECHKNGIPTTAGKLGYFNKIAVDFSGGIDSTALLCLIITELKRIGRLNAYQIVCCTVKKDDGATFYAERLVKKVSEHFGINISHINNGENKLFSDPNHVAMFSDIQGLQNKFNNIISFAGINRIPSNSVKTFQYLRGYASCNSQTYGSDLVESGVICPLLELHKPQILDIYYKLGCENLIQYTHSCVQNPIGECHECYSCEERVWGFELLGKTDPGTVYPETDDITFSGTWDTTFAKLQVNSTISV